MGKNANEDAAALGGLNGEDSEELEDAITITSRDDINERGLIADIATGLKDGITSGIN